MNKKSINNLTTVGELKELLKNVPNDASICIAIFNGEVDYIAGETTAEYVEELRELVITADEIV